MTAATPATLDVTGRDNRHYSPTQAAMALDLAAALEALTPHTRTAYQRQLSAFRSYCDGCGWNAPTPALLRPTVLEAWLASMRLAGRSPATCKQGKAAVCWAARQAKRAGLISATDLAELAEVRVSGGGGVRQGRWLTADDLHRLVRAQRGAGVRPVRDRAILALLAGCALRRAELCDLRIEHLAEQDGEPLALVNLVGKGIKLRSVAIPLWARPYVRRWLVLYRQQCDPGPSDPLVSAVDGGGRGRATTEPLRPASVHRILRQATNAAGLPDIAPHDLRRTAAKLMEDGGAGLRAIRDALGHASVATTERYLATASGPATATLAMDRLMEAHP